MGKLCALTFFFCQTCRQNNQSRYDLATAHSSGQVPAAGRQSSLHCSSVQVPTKKDGRRLHKNNPEDTEFSGNSIIDQKTTE